LFELRLANMTASVGDEHTPVPAEVCERRQRSRRAIKIEVSPKPLPRPLQSGSSRGTDRSHAQARTSRTCHGDHQLHLTPGLPSRPDI